MINPVSRSYGHAVGTKLDQSKVSVGHWSAQVIPSRSESVDPVVVPTTSYRERKGSIARFDRSALLTGFGRIHH